MAALSSKAFGGAPNNYQYQGDYSEFDDDLGWNDFALRSYDPQLGRFLQHDPYDQFASGYVGMGNDPGNGVDPTGGFFDPGPLAQLACPGSGGGSFLKVLNTISAIGSVASKGMGLGGSITSNMGNNNQSINQSANGGNSESSGPNEGSGVSGGTDENDCDCPEGYSSNPNSIFDIDISTPPLYRTEVQVVTYYSLMVKDVSGKELSGLIYYQYMKLKSGATKKFFTITGFDTKPEDPIHSPGPNELKHKLPPGAVPVVHIHNHYKTLPIGNQSFSVKYGLRHIGSDMEELLGNNYRWRNLNYWVLCNTGYLSKRFADNTPDPTNSSGGGKAGEIDEYKGSNFYKNPPGLPPCPCFKIK